MIFGCGRKGPPIAPEIIEMARVSNITVQQENKKIIVFFDYKEEADFFQIDLAKIDCEECPSNFAKLDEKPGDEKYFEFSGYEPGNYKLRIIAKRGRKESRPEVKAFKIE